MYSASVARRLALTGAGVRIIVTGSRDWRDHQKLRHTLDELCIYHPQVTIVHGMCDPRQGREFVPWEHAQQQADPWQYDGADWHADVHARARGWQVHPFPADWSKGRQGGPIRNWQMIRSGADLCVGFYLPNSAGAHQCLKAAVDADIPVLSIKG